MRSGEEYLSELQAAEQLSRLELFLVLVGTPPERRIMNG